ncbi:MAG TPA: hypothetical protein VK252_00695 [Solirubrobacteraceae bacterium]|nr:hypothetical protein [Solirubrobacteraceae bacterium]
MHGQSKQDGSYPAGCVDPSTEVLIVECVLGRARGMALVQVRKELDALAPRWVDESIESLQKAGVIAVKRTRLDMSPATRRLDDLNMVCV